MQTTPARSSRIKTSRRRSAVSVLGLKRATSSPSNVSPSKRSLPTEESTAYDEDEELDDLGIVASLASDLNFRDVPQYMEYIRNRMFSDMPEKAGMNSTRITEVLNFRKQLPPFVTIAHVDALSTSSTMIEREIAELAKKGVVRRVTIPHRGVGSAAVGDGIASVREWQALVRAHDGLADELKDKYIRLMDANPTSTTVPGSAFTPAEIAALTGTGLFTSITTLNTTASAFFASPGANSLSAISTSGSRHAAGSLEAVGGQHATQHMHGGTSLSSRAPSTGTFSFSLPHMGMHIKLLVDARNHLLSILKKARFKAAPLGVLRERWDGGVAGTGSAEREERKKARREFVGVLPGRTKKWKQFYGMRFEWILEECVGAGLVELFETGSVGRAVRLVS
ncbi:hypothetical protein BU25DRAFT_407880 [Macroventuria anomochaeta]|uniref:Uncharacterized protein n=1 Tax=Macroventuria anomochaeta TaxID=301207 RepID=A0ACB6S972_9PLEO|nr:uncharacterized protein BU25DRAFT_407880 [Macroventuria anomochaeta]KAF2630588.1 hypothetical protein BU25DRAFT_407880 [Macroventuria anomochaeta]